MIQSGVLRIFRMAVRGVCSLSALPVCFVSLLVRPVLSVLSALSALSCSVLLCPLVHPPVCPFVRLFRLLSICSVCSVLFCPVLSCSVRSSIRPFVHSFGCSAYSACFVSPSLRSFVPVRSVRSVRSVRFVRLPRPSICPFRSGAAEFYSADFAKCFVFFSAG